MNLVGSTQSIEKLAVIPRFLYSDGDFGGVEWPPHIDLRAISTSHSAGEKRANGLLQRLTTPFGKAVIGPALLAGAMIASPAMAKDDAAGPPVATAPAATLASMTPDSLCNQVEGYPRLNCATPGYETPMTQDEILENNDLVSNRIILHFGPGAEDVGLLAVSINNRLGDTAIAIPGGPEGGVHLIIDGYTGPKNQPQKLFNQDHIDGGQLGGFAERAYNSIMMRKSRRAELNLDR